MNTPPRPRLAVLIGLYVCWSLLIGQPAAPDPGPDPHEAQGIVADLGLKLPFEPGIPWEITNGWDAHARYEDIDGDGEGGDWNRYALDFVPANGVSCEGQPILAVAPGRIHSHDQDAFGAERLVIKHANELYSMYVHFQRGSVRLEAGDEVGYGTVIGACGSTGRSTGAHLHFQLYRGPTWDRNDGVLPLPMDGISGREQLRSHLGGFFSSNRPLSAAAACPPATSDQPTADCPSAQH